MASEFLKIEDLINYKSIVLLLGAGASKDYGFPLWDDLKTFLQENIEKVAIGEHKDFKGRLTEEDLTNLLRWREILGETDWSMTTIDNVIYKNGEIKDSILKIISFYISSCEKTDSELSNNEFGWVTVFAKKVADFLISKRTGDKNNDANFAKLFLEKIKIVSLNYDRSFEYHFAIVFRKYLEEGLDKNNNDWDKYYSRLEWVVVHPHGAIANRDQTRKKEFRIRPFYSTYKLSRNGSIFRDYGQFNDISVDFAEVDDLKDQIEANDAYNTANRCISEADVVISIGLSTKGIINSHIKFPEKNKYYFSNNPADREEIETKIKSTDQIYLDLHANELIELL